MDAAAATAIATVIAAAIAGLVGWATSRTAARAQVQAAQVTTRTDIEKEAFERARAYYGDALDRQDAEIRRQDAEISELHQEVDQLKHQVRGLEHDLALREDEVRRLSAVIAARGEI